MRCVRSMSDSQFPAGMFTTNNNTMRGLRLLSIDNGGIRGLSPLLLLKEILFGIRQQEGLPEVPRPCEIFDLAGGSGTGGIIVIMLFRLQMTIDAAIEAYLKLAEHVFAEKKWFFQEGTFKATRLEEAMLSIIQHSERGDPRQIPLKKEEAPKCFVTAVQPYRKPYPPAFLCSWASSSSVDWFNQPCTIVEAVRATTAVVNFFKPARAAHRIQSTYLQDSMLRFNNPTQFVVDKARELYGDRPISCLLSLGTGHLDVLGPFSRDAFWKWLPTKLLQTLQDVITDCELKSMEMQNELSRHSNSIYYSRLNDYNSEGSLAEWREFKHSQSCRWDLNLLVRVLKGVEVAGTTVVQTSLQSLMPHYGLQRIYHDELLRQGRGSPLWFPGPMWSLPKAYRQDGINVGDVGIIGTGCPFDFLFNIFLPADHPINSGGVPHLFQPLHNSGVDEFPYDTPGTIIGSSPRLSVPSHSDASGLIFETCIAEGAILVLPQGSWRKATRDRESMKEYMVSNIQTWYQFARKRVFGNGDLALVYQCDKAPSCGMASFSGCEGVAKSLAFGCVMEGQLMSPPFGWGLKHGPGDVCMRTGPYVGENEDLSEAKNQCVFVRTLNARLSKEEWEELKSCSSNSEVTH